MNEHKLKIETHYNNDTIKLNYAKTETNSYLENLKLIRNLYKAKIEDRKRIKGISFSTHKKEKNNFILYKLKKKDEATMLEYDEANFQKVLNNYNKLKHEIYLKEQAEKKIKTHEILMKEKIIKKDINYTFLKETLYQFMRFKKSYNNYSVNLLKNKNELKLAAKNSKKNFINKTVKNVMKKFNHLGGKIDMGGIQKREEIANEREFSDLIKQISKSRVKHLRSMSGTSGKKNLTNSPLTKHFESKKTKDFSFTNNYYLDYFKNNIQKENKKDDESLNISNFDIEENKKEKKVRDFNFINKTESNVTKNISINIDEFNTIKKRKSEIKNIINTNDSNEIVNKRPENSKFKTHIVSKPLINKLTSNKIIKTSIFDIKEKDNENENSSSKREKYKRTKDNHKNEEKNKSNDSSLILQDLINLDIIKKNNILRQRKKNPTYWNTNIKRLYTAVSRNNHKVTNKPVYVTKISDFVKEFKRIKSVSKSAKKRMKEKHFTTMDNIDKISKIKEELLMFILKMKYFHHSFPQKKIKTMDKKELFLKKFRNYLDIIDNPYSLATKELRAEIRKDEDNSE